MAINLNGTGSITGLTSISSPTISGGSLPAGSASTPGLTFSGDSNTGIYSPGADQIAISTSGTARLSIDATGNVAVDTNVLYVDAANNRVGIGTTSVNAPLHVSNGGAAGIEFYPATYEIQAYNRSTSAYGLARYNAAGHQFAVSASEAARIDSSGRLLVGTSSARSFVGSALNSQFQIEGTNDDTSIASITRNSNNTGSGRLIFGKSRGTANGSVTIVQSGDNLGSILFEGTDGTDTATAAAIDCIVDGTPGANDMPGRLVFSTTADGASSPTERVRITNGGDLCVGTTTSNDPTVAGRGFFRAYGNSDPSGFVTEGFQQTVGYINRAGNDGNLLEFLQADVAEGSISVSGTTVSYNGAHLSRWSQLPSGAERTEILRGSVLSNIDEMCEWGEEDNEQLNRMKVSDVEGDKNVSGVFQAWDDDDDTYTNDFYCAMTGDFIIRIGAGITVERGDLLMSAGDGTAKPQDDDIIRSKTIAKVTSTTVSCTYDDGSYCVPCVLMAC